MTPDVFSVGIVGAGKIGSKRSQALTRCPGFQLVGVADEHHERAVALARHYGGRVFERWEDLVQNSAIDILIVATTHRWLGPIAQAALESGKHVLCEKPLALTSKEAKRLVDLASEKGIKLKAGFNHRHHPAIQEAHRLVQQGTIGRILFLRSRYGHGGRTGYEAEWRADPAQSGGGELTDQAIHVLDLFRWFAGEFRDIYAVLPSAFWQMPVEDNAFCVLRAHGGAVGTLHASWTQWKNLFSFEVFGEDGYVVVDGLGGTYGKEKLTLGLRPPQFGPPHEEIMEFEGEDTSWTKELQEFAAAVREDRKPLADGFDGWQALRLVEAGYQSAREKRVVLLS